MSLKKTTDDNWEGFEKLDEPQDYKPTSYLIPQQC